MKKRLTKLESVRFMDALKPYPAVLLPLPQGGLDVIFPNFPGLKAYGIKREMALKAGEEALTAEVMNYALEGRNLPKSSDPDRLVPDEDEPYGTELVMIEPSKSALIKRLGLEKIQKGGALRSLGVFGR